MKADLFADRLLFLYLGMTITLKLTEEDYLMHILYSASKNVSIKKKRIRSWLLAAGSCFTVSAFCHWLNDQSNTYFFLMLGIVCLFGYPFYLKIIYQRHYEKQAAEVAKGKVDLTSLVQFTNEDILISDPISETKIHTSSIIEVNEISSHLFIKISTGESLIIPKRLIDENEFWKTINDIIRDKNILVNKGLDWRWK